MQRMWDFNSKLGAILHKVVIALSSKIKAVYWDLL